MVTNRAFDEIVDLLTSCPTPEEILSFKPSKKMQERVSSLLEKKRNDQISEEEKQELDHFMMIEHIMRIAKLRAKKRMAA